MPTCRRGDVQLTLEGNPVRAPGAVADFDPSVELPFAAEPGVGLVLGSQFFATGLRHEGGTVVAVLARFGANSGPSELVELARIKGDAAPPRLAADGADVIVGLQEANAGGYDLRVARVPSAAPLAPIDWRAAPHQMRDESNVFDLGAKDGRVLVVWDEWFAEGHHGRILASSIETESAAGAGVIGHVISTPGVDAEGPRLSRTHEGYWLAWLVNLDGATAGGRVYDPAAEDDDPMQPIRSTPTGARAIEVILLDSSGHARGAPVRVTGDTARVVGFDLTTSAAGHAWIVWRHDAPSSGANGGRISMAEVREAGGLEVSSLADEGVGAGEPSWLPSGDGSPPWLSFADDADRTQLLRVERPFVVTEPLRLADDWRGAAALGASNGQILFAAPRGGSIELFLARCDAPSQRPLEPEAAAQVSADASAPQQQRERGAQTP